MRQTRLRFVATALDGARIPLNAHERGERPGDVPYWGSGGVVDHVDAALFDEPLVLLGEDGAPFFDRTRDVAFQVSGPAWVNNHIHVLRPLPGVDHTFLCYALNAVDYSRYITGATRDKLTQSDMWNIVLPAHDQARQIAIADYLDRETARIDDLIAEQEALFNLLLERRASAIETASLATNASPQVDLSRIARKLTRPVLPSAEILTAFRDGQVTTRSQRRAEGFTESANQIGYQGVRAGDLVFHGLDGFAGAVGEAEADGKCSPVYHVFAPMRDVYGPWLADALRAMGTSGQLAVLAGNVRQRSVDFRAWATFGAIPIRVPSIDEQRDRHQKVVGARRADRLMAESRALIALLKERRAALITAAVTGELDMTGT